jgi:predicted MFS family arabinose efflux permease
VVKNNEGLSLITLRNVASTLSKNVFGGIKALKQERIVGITLIIVAVINFVNANYDVVCIATLKQDFNINDLGIGIFLAVFSVGAILGSFVATNLYKRLRFTDLLLICIAIQVICRAALIFSVSPVLILISYFIVSFSDSIINIIIITNRQVQIGQNNLGKVTSIYKMLLIGIQPLGLLFGGVVMQSVGFSSFYQLFGVLNVLCLVLAVRSLRKGVL